MSGYRSGAVKTSCAFTIFDREVIATDLEIHTRINALKDAWLQHFDFTIVGVAGVWNGTFVWAEKEGRNTRQYVTTSDLQFFQIWECLQSGDSFDFVFMHLAACYARFPHCQSCEFDICRAGWQILGVNCATYISVKLGWSMVGRVVSALSMIQLQTIHIDTFVELYSHGVRIGSASITATMKYLTFGEVQHCSETGLVADWSKECSSSHCKQGRSKWLYTLTDVRQRSSEWCATRKRYLQCL